MHRLSGAFSVAAFGTLILCPAADAQGRGRIALTPEVSWLVPSAYYARKFEAERSSGKVRIGQKSLPLFSAQLSYELPGSPWRIGLGYARGESDLKVYHYTLERGQDPGGGLPVPISERETQFAFPATRELLTLSAATRIMSGPVAFELGSALVLQRLDATVLRGFFSSERVEDQYSDWGMEIGGSASPGSGWAQGLRLGVRGHLLRTSPAMYDVFRSRSTEPEADAEYETAFAASLGWRLAF